MSWSILNLYGSLAILYCAYSLSFIIPHSLKIFKKIQRIFESLEKKLEKFVFPFFFLICLLYLASFILIVEPFFSLTRSLIFPEKIFFTPDRILYLTLNGLFISLLYIDKKYTETFEKNLHSYETEIVSMITPILDSSLFDDCFWKNPFPALIQIPKNFRSKIFIRENLFCQDFWTLTLSESSLKKVESLVDFQKKHRKFYTLIIVFLSLFLFTSFSIIFMSFNFQNSETDLKIIIILFFSGNLYLFESVERLIQKNKNYHIVYLPKITDKISVSVHEKILLKKTIVISKVISK